MHGRTPHLKWTIGSFFLWLLLTQTWFVPSVSIARTWQRKRPRSRSPTHRLMVPPIPRLLSSMASRSPSPCGRSDVDAGTSMTADQFAWFRDRKNFDLLDGRLAPRPSGARAGYFLGHLLSALVEYTRRSAPGFATV